MYEYNARLATPLETPNPVYDGDTVTLLIDVGFNSFRLEKCRLFGIDTPELKTGDKKAEGKAARDFLLSKLEGKKLKIRTHKDAREKFDRILAEIVIYGETMTVNQQMIDSGHAIAYFGGKKD